MKLTNFFINSWIRNISSYEELDAKLRDSSSFEEFFLTVSQKQVIGTLFELFAKQILLKKWTFVFLWSEIPKEVRNEFPNATNVDNGIDIIVSEDSESWTAVQVKWRSANQLKTPQVVMDHFECEMTRCGFSNGIMFTNFTQAHTTRHAFENINMQWITEADLHELSDPGLFQNMISKATSPTSAAASSSSSCRAIVPREYQLDALDALCADKSSRKQVIMACGTGKTFVMYKYLEPFLGTSRILILVPSLYLMNQMYSNFWSWNSEFMASSSLCICCDMDSNGYIIPNFTTDIAKVNQHMARVGYPLIISTYQSAPILLHDFAFDQVIFDEAHRTVGTSDGYDSRFGYALHDKNIKCNIERLFFTATQKSLSSTTGMTDIDTYGDVVYSYTFQQAINDKWINDFALCTYLAPPFVLENQHVQDKDILLCAVELAQYILQNPKKHHHIVTYHNTINHAKEFARVMRYIVDKKQYNIPNVKVWSVDGRQHVSERSKIIREFESHDMSILCSARVLSEGVNIPCINSVMFTEKRTSPIDITQSIGRGLRIYGESDTCDVIIPTFYDDIAGEHDFSNVVNILLGLREIDEQIVHKFLTQKRNIIPFDHTLSNGLIAPPLHASDFSHDIHDICLDTIMKHLTIVVTKSNQLCFDYKMRLLFEFCDKNNRMPEYREVYKGVRLGAWIGTQKYIVRDGNRTDIYNALSENTIVKSDLDKYLAAEKPTIIPREDVLIMMRQFCEEHERVPMQKEMINGYALGTWLADQKKKVSSCDSPVYKELSALSPHLKACLDNYLDAASSRRQKMNDDEAMSMLRSFFNEHDRTPTSREKWNDIQIGHLWQHKIRKVKKINDRHYIMLSNIHPRAKECIDLRLSKSSNPTFDEWIDLVSSYIKKYNRLPKTREKYKERDLRSWISKQRNHIKSRDDERYVKLASLHHTIRKFLDEKIKK